MQTGRDAAQTTVLEVAAGTGRFHTFLRDNFPALSTVCSDLSPFYLAEARDNMAYWEQFTGSAVAGRGDTSFVQANGEDMPFADESFDAVLNVYLFHEMPMPARRYASHTLRIACRLKVNTTRTISLIPQKTTVNVAVDVSHTHSPSVTMDSCSDITPF
jgi:SAM-dependent methyltransferase